MHSNQNPQNAQWKLLWVYCPRHAGMKGNDRAETSGQSDPHNWLASRKIWSVEELERPSAGTKPRASHHRSPGGERRGKKKRWTIFLERTRGPSSVRRTLEPFQRQRLEDFWETGWSACGLFRAHRYYLELNWTEPRTSRAVTQRVNTVPAQIIKDYNWSSNEKLLKIPSVSWRHLFGTRCRPLSEMSQSCLSSNPTAKTFDCTRVLAESGTRSDKRWRVSIRMPAVCGAWTHEDISDGRVDSTGICNRYNVKGFIPTA